MYMLYSFQVVFIVSTNNINNLKFVSRIPKVHLTIGWSSFLLIVLFDVQDSGANLFC